MSRRQLARTRSLGLRLRLVDGASFPPLTHVKLNTKRQVHIHDAGRMLARKDIAEPSLHDEVNIVSHARSRSNYAERNNRPRGMIPASPSA